MFNTQGAPALQHGFTLGAHRRNPISGVWSSVLCVCSRVKFPTSMVLFRWCALAQIARDRVPVIYCKAPRRAVYIDMMVGDEVSILRAFLEPGAKSPQTVALNRAHDHTRTKTAPETVLCANIGGNCCC